MVEIDKDATGPEKLVQLFASNNLSGTLEECVDCCASLTRIPFLLSLPDFASNSNTPNRKSPTVGVTVTTDLPNSRTKCSTVPRLRSAREERG